MGVEAGLVGWHKSACPDCSNQAGNIHRLLYDAQYRGSCVTKKWYFGMVVHVSTLLSTCVAFAVLPWVPRQRALQNSTLNTLSRHTFKQILLC